MLLKNRKNLSDDLWGNPKDYLQWTLSRKVPVKWEIFNDYSVRK
jgi:hypothetical protein